MLSEIDIERIKSVVSLRKEISYAILFGSGVERLLAHSDIDLLIGIKRQKGNFCEDEETSDAISRIRSTVSIPNLSYLSLLGL